MRSSGDLHGTRSRKDQDPITPTSVPSHGAPTSFFLATEDMLHRSHNGPDYQPADSTYGVRSLPETTDEAKQGHDSPEGSGQDAEETSGRRRSTLRAYSKTQHPSSEGSSYRNDLGTESPSFDFPRLSSTVPSVSSLSQDSQGATHSLLSSPKSTSSRSGRPSDRDSIYDGASQAIASSEDEAEIDQPPGVLTDAPQLIMPSIQMPSRRPFTERGKGLDKVKILLAGDSGLGKTSLIKSIVQVCEDIVHVDPVSMTASSTDQAPESTGKHRPMKASTFSTTQINEVWASTKAYPGWWTELEENKALRRRKSIEELVLERNLCFVDTPGYGRGLSITEGIQEVTSYVEAQLARSLSSSVNSKGELVSMLGGNGGTQVDVVLYLIGQAVKPADLDFLQRLSQITNIIPLIAQADTLEPAALEALRLSISNELTQLDIRSFNFAADGCAAPPYAVCSAPSNDKDNMDASLLMSSEYFQPLLPSQLGVMIDHLLDKDNLARLRYLSAKKLVRSKNALQLVSTAISSSNSSYRVSQADSLATASHTLIPDPPLQSFASHQSQGGPAKHKEERAQARLAKWANELRHSTRSQQPIFERSQQRETSSLGEKSRTLSELASTSTFPYALNQVNDPLGLLRGDEYLRQHGWKIIQVVGAFGVFGAVAVWVARNWSSSNWMGWGNDCSDWTRTWVECKPWTY